MQYIHYGSRYFESSRFKEISNRYMFVKPDGGLWASPVNCEHSWKQWCENNDFKQYEEDDCFSFTLTKDAKIYQIFCRKDIESLPQIDYDFPNFSNTIFPDFEKIKENGIDAIQYNLSQDTTSDYFTGLYFSLYGWDCDCILVLNKDVIVEEPIYK